MFGPRSRISPSSVGDPHLDSRHRAPDGPELEVIERSDRAYGGRLGHAPAFEHGHAAGVEELEDLGCDRRCPAHRLMDLIPEQGPHARVQALIRGGKRLLHLGRHGLAALPTPPHLDTELDRLLEPLPVLVARLLLQLHRRRVELLEDPRHRGKVGRVGLDQLLDHPLGVAAEVDDRRPEVVRGELRGQRERVRERQEQVGLLAGLHEVQLLHHLADRHRVAMRQHDSLRWAGRARRVDDRVGVSRGDRRQAI